MRRLLSDKLLAPGVVGAAVKVAGVGLSFLFTKAVTQICGAEGWGLFAICLNITLLAVSVARLGVDTVLVKTIGQASALAQFHRLSSALRQSTLAVGAVSLGLGGGLWVLAPWLAVQFGKPVLADYLRITAFWIPVWAPLFLFTECLRGFGKTAAFVFLQTGLPYLVGFMLLLPVLTGALPAFSPDPAMITYGLGLGLSCAIAFWLLRRTFHRARLAGARGRFPFRTLRRTALPVLSTYLLVVVLGQVDVLLLGRLTPSAAETGVYALGLRLSNLMLMPVQALGAVTAAGLAGLYAKGRKRELAHTLRRTGRLIRLGTVPLWAGLCLLSPWVMGFFGQGFEMGWPILIILASNQLFNALCGPIDVLLQMTGRERTYRNLIAMALVVNVAANLLLIPRFGMYGAAAAHSLTLLSWNLVGVWRIYRLYGFWLLRVW